jgi:probable HAF family extracellular repeat protein
MKTSRLSGQITHFLVSTLSIVLGLVTASYSSPQSTYSITDLGSLTGESTTPHKVNLSGMVAAQSGSRDGARSSAAVWSSNRRLHALDAVPGSDYSDALGINNQGDVVGVASLATAMTAVFWSASGFYRILDPVPGDSSSRAYAVNNLGQVAGVSSGARGIRACLWTPDGTAHPLASDGQSATEAFGLNNHGQIVGWGGMRFSKHAILWNSPAQSPLDLGTLPNDSNSRALAINDAGNVVGSSSDSHGTRAFLWTEKAGMSLLSGLPATSWSEAIGINNSSQIVGSYQTAFGNHAFLWSPSTGFQDLNDLIPVNAGVVLTLANDITDRGQITVIGVSHYDLSDQRAFDADEDAHGINVHAFLLTPGH